MLAKIGRKRIPESVSETVDADQLVWALAAAKRHYPFETTCLADALAAEGLFSRYSVPGVLCVGVARSNGQFRAHAWLEADHEVLVGGPLSMVEEYTRLPEIGFFAQ